MSQYYEVRRDPFLVSTDPALLDIDVIHHYLSAGSYWAINIPRETVERSLRNSICFGVYHQQKQIGLSRVITDKATFAYLADVFILQEYRGKGLSKWMMEVIHAHPELQELRRWMLGTKDAHGLYEQFGWTALDDEAKRRFMQKVNKNAYQ
jgi:GNAT superfamily N-acetyltransferase